MINLHPTQSEVFQDMFVRKTNRYSAVCCSRGWGKSYLGGAASRTAVDELLMLDTRVPNKNVYVVAPTYDQAIDIYFPILAYDFGLEDICVKKPSKDTGRFILPKNVELRLLSYEAIQRMRGKGAYFVLWDEVSSCFKGMTAKDAWQNIIQPCIATRWSKQRAVIYNSPNPGRAMMISTPDGYNDFHEFSTYELTDNEWKSYQFDFTTSPFLDPEEIESLRHKLDRIAFASEYLASYVESGNTVFYCFSRNTHVRVDLEDFTLPKFNRDKLPSDDTIEGRTILKYGEDVHVAIDFNVMLQCTTANAVRGNQVHTLEEFKGSPDTDTLAKALAKRFYGHKIIAYPDPSGRSRKTSATIGKTDFSILESYGIECRAHKAAPSMKDSVTAVNSKLLTAAGDVQYYIHPRCVGAINSLERTKWKKGTDDDALTIDKSESIEHYSDGLRYLIEYLFPVRNGQKRVQRGFGF